MCRPYIDTNNTQGMQLGRFKNRTPARFEYCLYICVCICIVVGDPIIQRGGLGILLTDLTPPHFCAYPKN
jgi:hypothetical protein